MNMIDANAVVAVAAAIARCDFRVSLTRYITHDSPWYIAVGESNWARTLRVQSVVGEGEDAELELLSSDGEVEREVTLKELVADRYAGVKKILMPVLEEDHGGPDYVFVAGEDGENMPLPTR